MRYNKLTFFFLSLATAALPSSIEFFNLSIRLRSPSCAFVCSPTRITSLVASCKGISEMNRLLHVNPSNPSMKGEPINSSEFDSGQKTIRPFISSPWNEKYMRSQRILIISILLWASLHMLQSLNVWFWIRNCIWSFGATTMFFVKNINFLKPKSPKSFRILFYCLGQSCSYYYDKNYAAHANPEEPHPRENFAKNVKKCRYSTGFVQKIAKLHGF